MLTDTDEDGEYVIPRIIYSDAYSSEMVAYADLILPDTTYLERHDCISLLDRPISRARRRGRRDPLAGGRARPRRARLPVGAARPRRPAGPAGLRGRGRHGQVRRLRRLHREPRAPARASARWPAGAWARAGCVHGRGEPNGGQIASYIANGGFFAGPCPGRGRLLQAVEPRLPGLGGRDRASTTARSPTSSSSAASRCAGSSSPPRARAGVQPPDHLRAADPRHLGPAADLVCAAGRRSCRPGGIPDPRADPAADGDVPFLGRPERLAAPDPRPEPALPADRDLGARTASPRRLGARDLAPRRDHRAGRADGGAQRQHGLDLERHRQAQGRLGARPRRARGDARASCSTT